MTSSSCKTIQALAPSAGPLVGTVAWAEECLGTMDRARGGAPGVSENEAAGADARIDSGLYTYLHDGQARRN